MAQSRKEKQKQKKRQARRKKIAHMQRQFYGDEILILPAGGRASMSEAIIDFLEIDGYDWPDEEELRTTLVMGMAVWNAAVASGAEREDYIRSILALMPHEVRAEARGHLNALIQRKESLFPDNKRLMVDYALAMTPSGPHIQVLSTLDVPY